MGMMVVNTAAVAGGGTTWPTWDGVTAGMIGSDNIFNIVVEGGLGANETGTDGGTISGLDLVMTDVMGDIAGVSNNRRLLDGIDQDFSLTQTALQAFLVGTTDWSIVAKVRTVAGPDTTGYYIGFLGTNANIALYHNANAKLTAELDDVDEALDTIVTANNMSASTDYWIAVWQSTADNTTRIGFTAAGSGAGGQPTKLSDFAGGDRAVSANVYDNFGTFESRRQIGSNTATYLNFSLYNFTISNTALIDNLS